MYYLMICFIGKYADVQPENGEKKFNIKEKDDNIIIECINNINFYILGRKESKKYFLYLFHKVIS